MEIEFNQKSLDIIDAAKKMIEYIKAEEFENFLFNLDINSPEYSIFHNAYIHSSNTIMSWDKRNFPNMILKDLLDKNDVQYSLNSRVYGNDKNVYYVGYYKDIEFFELNLDDKIVKFEAKRLFSMDNHLKNIEYELISIKELLSSKKLKPTQEASILESFSKIEQDIKNTNVPWEVFSKKEDELKLFFKSIGFTVESNIK